MRCRLVTLSDVAEAAGVSGATVSVVLNDKSGKHTRVSSATKEKVLKAASSLGYVPNMGARQLKSGQNRTISVFTYENMFPVDSMSEFYSFFAGIQKEAARNGYDLLIVNNRPFGRVTAAAGSIMIGLNRDDKDIAALSKRGFPIVFVGRREIDGVKADYVTFDYKAVISEFVTRAAERVKDNSLIFLSGAEDAFEPSKDKNIFLHEECSSHSIELKTFQNTDDIEFKEAMLAGRVAFLNRLSQIDEFEVWCTSNNLTIGKDIEALVLEDDWEGRYSSWTRWENKRQELGSLAVRELLHNLDEDNFPKPEKLTAIPAIYSESFPL